MAVIHISLQFFFFIFVFGLVKIQKYPGFFPNTQHGVQRNHRANVNGSQEFKLTVQ